jgi:DNA-binding NarL/FixJ family response regulator
MDTLSERQCDVLRLIAEGLTSKEIAARLGVTLKTVATHTERIFDKLGASNRTHAAALWYRREESDGRHA